MQHGGPCQTPEDVERMVSSCDLQKDKRAALQVQMKYQKTVLGHKSPLLKTSIPNIARLMQNLKNFLRQQYGIAAAPGQQVNEQHSVQCRDGDDPDPRIQPAEDVEPMEVDPGDLSSSTDVDAEDCSFGDFLFTKTGQYVAVFYDTDFHVGSVSTVISPELAEVNFLKKCSVSNNTYVWPHRPELDKMSSLFVFASDFEVCTQNGRVWSVPGHDTLQEVFCVQADICINLPL